MAGAWGWLSAMERERRYSSLIRNRQNTERKKKAQGMGENKCSLFHTCEECLLDMRPMMIVKTEKERMGVKKTKKSECERQRERNR